jgi:hypothetical protein
LVMAFGLSISLRVISGRCNGVIKELSKGMREFQYELWSMIRDNLVIESKLSVNMFEEKFGYRFRHDHFQTGNNNYPLLRPWSTTTMIELKPLEGGRSVMRSTDRKVKGTVVVEGIGIRGRVTGWVSDFIC